MKLQASTRLKLTASHLVSTPAMEAAATEVYDLMLTTFKRMGWKSKKDTQSASTTIWFSKNGSYDEPGYAFTWHLPSKRWGTKTRFIDLRYFPGDHQASKLLIEADILGSEGEHNTACKEAIKFLRELKR